MRELYGHRDSRRGPERTLLWLISEVGEVADAVVKNRSGGIEEEMADVLAWLASLANVLDIDLERAFSSKYGDGCPRCASKPCNCPEG
ncbi:MAG: nucleotide pyrophosphohydrolase [Thaumarchaeota archaeon]|nr:nucleotide pyrophosphohydrolase [Candidatus Calditenuaceae archaeon]MDW8042410.1 MazG nucleotide pyrophosphohydrolase domain-containing protein [Nitrososphaerota archaeon]